MKVENTVINTEDESAKSLKQNLTLSTLNFQLNIGYDGKRAANNLTGLGNYSRSLIEHLAEQFPENHYFIYTPKIKESILKLPLFNKKQVNLELPKKGKFKIFWRSMGIKSQLIEDKIKLFHGLSHEIPFSIQQTNIKSIVTIHDLIFLRKPQYYQLIDRTIYKFKSRYACKNADQIIAISERTKLDIIDFYGIDPHKIEVIYQSCDDQFKQAVSPSEKEKISKKYQLPEKYILNVGSIEERKNLLLLIKALPKIDAAYKLVVVGKETPYFSSVEKEIAKLGLADRIVFLKNVPFGDLPSIYQLAKLFIYPSFYEGFGIPIIEALYGNVPVIAATGSCLEEAGGMNSIYIDPHDHESLASAANRILGDENLQQTMKEKGLAYVQKFDQQLVSQQLMQCYLNTLSK